MRVMVRLPIALRPFADGRAEVPVQAATVGSALADLLERYPSLRRQLYAEDGALRSYVNVFLNEDDLRYCGGEAAELRDGDVISIIPSIAGG